MMVNSWSTPVYKEVIMKKKSLSTGLSLHLKVKTTVSTPVSIKHDEGEKY